MCLMDMTLIIDFMNATITNHFFLILPLSKSRLTMPIDIDKIANNDCNLALEENNHNQASNRVNEL